MCKWPALSGQRESGAVQDRGEASRGQSLLSVDAELRRTGPRGAGMGCADRKIKSSRLRAREIDGSVVKSTY